MSHINLLDIVSQCLDSKGKCLILNFEKNSVIVWPPYAPLEDIKTSDTFLYCSMVEAKNFASKNNLKIIQKDEHNLTENGLYLSANKDPRMYYVPLENSSRYESVLDAMKNYKTIANYLKSYSVFEWSHSPNDFSSKSYVVDPNHKYEVHKLEGKLLRHNVVMYKNKKLVVLSEEMRDRLINYVQIETSKHGTLQYVDICKARKYVDGYITDPNNYNNENCTIFSNKINALTWEFYTKQNIHIIYYSVKSHTLIEPYLLTIPHILNGRTCIVQNTLTNTRDSAVFLSATWAKYKVNLGFSYKSNVEYEDEYNIYSSDEVIQTVNSDVHILLIEGDKYAALLPM